MFLKPVQIPSKRSHC